jgi:hypothetical protein
MAKSPLACPFSNKACTECGIYRGRHQSRNVSGRRREGTDGRGERHRPAAPDFSADFRILRSIAEPEKPDTDGTKLSPRVRLKVIDVEKGDSRICGLQEAETWDWKNAGIWRIVDGWQVAGFDRLIQIVRFKAERGQDEVEIYEAPRFMLLAGG